MELLYKSLKMVFEIFYIFILFGISVRIASKIIFSTFFEEKIKKGINQNEKNYTRTKKSRISK